MNTDRAPGYARTACDDCQVEYYTGTTVRITNMENKPTLCYFCARLRVFTRDMEKLADLGRCRECNIYPQIPGDTICHRCDDPTLYRYLKDYEGQRWWWYKQDSLRPPQPMQAGVLNRSSDTYVWPDPAELSRRARGGDLERETPRPTYDYNGPGGHDLFKYSISDIHEEVRELRRMYPNP